MARKRTPRPGTAAKPADASSPRRASSVSDWLDRHALALSLGLALLSAVLVSWGAVGRDVIPFGDGRTMAQRAIQLTGLLHAGRIHEFLDLFCSPGTVTLLPTFAVFLLLPASWASGTTYGLINCALWHVLLALPLYGIFQMLRRPALAPAALLLTVANNYALDASYYFYMDLPFMSCCLVAVAARMRALLSGKACAWAVSGLATAALLWAKPGSSFPIIGLDVFSALLFLGWELWTALPLQRLSVLKVGVRNHLVWSGGFLVVALPALFWWTGAQRIVGQMMTNQLAGDYWSFKPAMPTNLLLSLTYFPLCLTFFYSLFFLIVLAGGLCLLHRWLTGEEWQLEPREKAAIGAVACSFLLAWGGVFSWLMATRIIRSLPLMLPVLWIGLFAVRGVRRIRPAVILAAALAYFSLAHLQLFCGFLEKQNRWAERYELVGDWWNRLPAKKQDLTGGMQVTRRLLDTLGQMGVTTGRVAVGTEMLAWDMASLNWVSQVSDLQAGKEPRLAFVTACDNTGHAIEGSLTGANALLLVVHPRVQYSQPVYEFNVKSAQYASKEWRGSAARDIQALQMGDGATAAVFVALREPLTGPLLEAYVRNCSPKGYSPQAALAAVMDAKRLPAREVIKTAFDLVLKRYPREPAPK